MRALIRQRRALDRRADWRAAQIAYYVALSGGAKNAEFEDFMPPLQGDEEDDGAPRQTWQEQLAMFEAMAARSGEQGKRDSGVAG